jgi:hypothetical protein
MNTKHTCGGPKFGRLATKGECKRCDELHNGAKARSWNVAKRNQSNIVSMRQTYCFACPLTGMSPCMHGKIIYTD